jgi:hypothetical protein
MLLVPRLLVPAGCGDREDARRAVTVVGAGVLRAALRLRWVGRSAFKESPRGEGVWWSARAWLCRRVFAGGDVTDYAGASPQFDGLGLGPGGGAGIGYWLGPAPVPAERVSFSFPWSSFHRRERAGKGPTSGVGG